MEKEIITAEENTEILIEPESTDVTENEDTLSENDAEEVATLTTQERLLAMMGEDCRVGHFIVDILNGVDVDEASKRYFCSHEPSLDVDAIVSEAEKRGYLRGKNEKIAMEMRRPSLWESSCQNSENDDDTRQPIILNHLKRSIWD